VTLQPASVWNPADILTNSSSLSETYIDFDVPAVFGYIASDITPFEQPSYDLSNAQLFAKEDWVPLAEALQAAQQVGNGIVATFTHTTVANAFYNIEAGQKVTVTWVYTGRVRNWEKQLSKEMQALVVPQDDPENLGNLIQTGPFKKFPNVRIYHS
jgi:hypothetical protein